ncbi:MAG: Xaa-Pro aminopeptidase [Candidatus Symbiodolus clandestinus]
MVLEFQQRRRQVLLKMAPASAALFFAAELTVRSRDTHYFFQQDSDFWYLTGFSEPGALLVLLKSASGEGCCLLFNQPRDSLAEKWQGRRLGQATACQQLGVDQAFSIQSVQKQLPELLNRLTTVYHAPNRYPAADKMLDRALEQLRTGKAPAWQAPITITDWQPWLHEMRLIKSETELALMRQAAKINVAAHQRALQSCRPGLFEYHLEAELHYAFAQQGARYPAYPSIVGSGTNGCILHYTENSAPLCEGDLVLIDAGCSYQGYASDITRTWPISGRFTHTQAALYDLVWQMQQAALQQLGPEKTLRQADQAAIAQLVPGLLHLGLLKGKVEQLIAEQAYRPFYCHNLGHWLGLDVHDVGDFQSSALDRPLQPGMVLTIEPGIYIDLDAAVPPPYRGIGIRLEDNLVITASGYELLTEGLIKQRSEIEAVMSRR